MRTTLVLLSIVLLILTACAPDKPAAPAPYADLKAVYQQVTDTEEQLATGLASATDGKKVAATLKIYTSKMRDLSPKLTAVQAKYPELQSATVPPDELKTTVEALNASTGKMMDSLAKVQQFLEDPEVIAAMNDLSAAAREAQPK